MTFRLRVSCLAAAAATFALSWLVESSGLAQQPAAGAKPNILVIYGDDIGISNVSAYSDGLMGYETPNIDRIAKEGIRFLHY
jgi:hypothetical protein